MHQLIVLWFDLVKEWGYLGVVVLMAMESSIFPVPSEVVMPPAAFWAAQGKMSFWGVVLAGTVGSYLGSIISYYVAQWVGAPLLRRYGRYVLMPPEKVRLAEVWVRTYGTGGIFFARLLPVICHLISIPAGILHMPVWSFSAATIIGSALWCTVLSWFGSAIIGSHPELMDSPEGMIHAVKANLHWFVAAVLLLAALYAVVLVFKKRMDNARNSADCESSSN